MKQQLLAFVIAMIATFKMAHSQSVEASFKNLSNCVDIEVEAMKIIPNFYFKKQYDSIELTLDYVKLNCVETESLRIIRILLQMENKTFTDSSLTSADIYLIKKEAKYLIRNRLSDFGHFIVSSEYTSSRFYQLRSSLGNGNVEQKMSNTLLNWTMRILKDKTRTSLEKSVLEHIINRQKEFVTGHNLFREVGKAKYKNSPIRKIYDRYHDNFVMNRNWQFSIGYTHWLSQAKETKTFHSKPGMFFSLGKLINKKDRIDIYVAGRFGATDRPLQIIRPDTSFLTSKADATLFGLDYTRTLWRPNRKFEMNAIIGLGSDNRIFFDNGNEKTLKDSPSDLYVNVGSEFKFFVFSGGAINISPRYIFSGKFKDFAVPNFRENILSINVGFTIFFGGRPARSFWALNR